MVSVKCQPTTRTRMDTFSQRFFLAMPTVTTVLRGIRGIDRHELPTSICCFVGEKRSELRPCRILDDF